MGRVALGCRHQSSPAQTTTQQKSCFLLSFLLALWFLAVQCCSFYTDLQARGRWGYLPEMWECGLKSPQAEEASNPSLNGGPSAVARNAADHRLSCIIDSSPVSVAKSIRMLLYPLPAAVLTQGSAPIPAPALSLCGGSSRPVLLLPMVSFAAGSLQLRGLVWCKQSKSYPPKGSCCSPSISESKNCPLGFNHWGLELSQQRGALGQKGFLFHIWAPFLVAPAGENATVQAAETAGSCCGPGAILGGDQWCGHLTNPLLPPARAGVETKQQLLSLLQTLSTERSSSRWTPAAAGLPSEEMTPKWV